MGGDVHVARSFKDKHSLIQKEGAIISDIKYEFKGISQVIETHQQKEIIRHSELFVTD